MGDDEQIAPVEQEVRDLSAGLQLVKDEQAYLVVRERVHRDSAFSHFLTAINSLYPTPHATSERLTVHSFHSSGCFYVIACESTNSRVKWWSIAQIVILLGVCGWNIHYLKSWFEVKRVL